MIDVAEKLAEYRQRLLDKESSAQEELQNQTTAPPLSSDSLGRLLVAVLSGPNTVQTVPPEAAVPSQQPIHRFLWWMKVRFRVLVFRATSWQSDQHFRQQQQINTLLCQVIIALQNDVERLQMQVERLISCEESPR